MSKAKNNKRDSYNLTQFVKGYISVATILVAFLPIPVAVFGWIPTFQANRQFLATSTSLLCLLILAFSFSLRHLFPKWMFKKKANRLTKFFSFFLVGILMVICFFCILAYNSVLDSSIHNIKCDVTSELLPGCNKDTQQPETSESNSSDKGKVLGIKNINRNAYLKYFGDYPNQDQDVDQNDDTNSPEKELFNSIFETFNRQFILENATPYHLTNFLLILLYMGIFVNAQIALSIMCLREYLEEHLEEHKLSRNKNFPRIYNSVLSQKPEYLTEDWNNLTEELQEIEYLLQAEKKGIKYHLRVIVLNLLKCKYIKTKDKKDIHNNGFANWLYSIEEHRQRLYDYNYVYDQSKISPSLKKYCQKIYPSIYEEARNLAAKETEMAITNFPEEHELSLEDILKKDWEDKIEVKH